MSTLASSAYQREVLRAKGMDDEAIMGKIQPILIDTHQIGKPVGKLRSISNKCSYAGSASACHFVNDSLLHRS